MSTDRPSTPARTPLLLAGAVLLAAAAGFGAFVASLWHEFAFEGADKPWELTWQLVVACCGFGATVAMTYLVARGRGAAAAVALVAALLLFAIWAVLVDAATHGWGDGPVPF